MGGVGRGSLPWCWENLRIALEHAFIRQLAACQRGVYAMYCTRLRCIVRAHAPADTGSGTARDSCCMGSREIFFALVPKPPFFSSGVALSHLTLTAILGGIIARTVGVMYMLMPTGTDRTICAWWRCQQSVLFQHNVRVGDVGDSVRCSVIQGIFLVLVLSLCMLTILPCASRLV